MSYADQLFKQDIRNILENGTNTRGQKVRPHWEDGTPAYTIKQFGVSHIYDLRKEFPAITVRPTALKTCMEEILWIFQRKSNKLSELKAHIWDEWGDDKGTIGKAYGYQIGEKFLHHKCTVDELELLKEYPSVEIISKSDSKYDIYMDQMDGVLYDLKYNTFSRRIMTSLWNVKELHEMNLQPCCWNVTFNVTDENEGKLVLNMVLNQRSNDHIVANNFNTAQYAILLMMVAQVSDMIPGKLMHNIVDQHIYDRHIDIAKELLERPEHPAPKVWLDPSIKNFYDFNTSHIHVENYVTEPQIKNIPVAI